jgi:predicted MFS family arabinose efflux permease
VRGKPETDRRYLLTLLILIYICNNMDRHILSTLAVPITRDLVLSDTQFGLLTGLAFALFYTFFGIPAGWLADRIGRIRVLFVAAIIWSVCSASGALATKFWHLALARAGVGIGEAGGVAPSYSLISSHFPAEKRGNAIGLFQLGAPLATVISSFGASWVAVHYGWRWAIIAVSMPGVLFAMLLWMTVAEPPAHDEIGSKTPLMTSVRTFWGDRIFRNLAIATGISSFTSFAVMAWLPKFLIQSRGMSQMDVGIWYGPVYAVSFGLGLWGGGWLTDRLVPKGGRWYALAPCIALLCAAPFLVPMFLVSSWKIALLFAFPAIGLLAMFLVPAVTCVQNRSHPDCRAVNGGLFLFINNLVGAGLGPAYVGWISDFTKGAHVSPLGLPPLGVGLMACLPILLIAAALQARNARLLASDR